MQTNTMLKLEVKQKWLEALRSGEYQQGTNRLRTGENYYCCLGVLCNISNSGEWKPSGIGYKYEGEGIYPPASVIRWVFDINSKSDTQESIKISDLKDSEGFVKAIQPWKYGCGWEMQILLKRSVFEVLSTINDGGATFEQIAQIIEKYL